MRISKLKSWRRALPRRVALRALLRNGSSDDDITTAIAHIWEARADRYSQLRGSAQAVRQAEAAERRVEMSYIGG